MAAHASQILILAPPGSDELAAAVHRALASTPHTAHQMPVIRLAGGAFPSVREADAIIVLSPAGTVGLVSLLEDLTHEQGIAAATPVLVCGPTRSEGAELLDCLRGGAWDCFGLQEIDELPAKLTTFLRIREEMQLLRNRILIDYDTDFYNLRGLIRRMRELASYLFRYEMSVACYVIGPRPSHAWSFKPDAVSQILVKQVRGSDLIGRIADKEFALVLPGISETAATALGERFLEALSGEGDPRWKPSPVCVGYSWMENAAEAAYGVVDLLGQARRTLRELQEAPVPSESIRAHHTPRVNGY